MIDWGALTADLTCAIAATIVVSAPGRDHEVSALCGDVLRAYNRCGRTEVRVCSCPEPRRLTDWWGRVGYVFTNAPDCMIHGVPREAR